MLRQGLLLFVLYISYINGDIIHAEFEGVSLHFQPDNVVFTEQSVTFCINYTAKVSGSNNVRILEGDTFKATLHLVGTSYMTYIRRIFNLTVTSVEDKTRTGVRDGSHFTSLATISTGWLGANLCRHSRLLCVEIVPGRRFEENNENDNWICLDIRKRLRCPNMVDTIPTCKIPSYPEFIKRPEDTYANINDSVVFECTIKPKRAKSIEWFFEGRPIKQGDPTFMNTLLYLGGVLMLNPVSSHHFGTYSCKATDYSGTTIEAQAYLEEKSSACDYLIVERPLNRTVKAGLPVLLNCMADDANAIYWWKDGIPLVPNKRIQQMTYGQLLIGKVEVRDAGVYECVVEKGPLSCSMTSTLQVFANADEVCGLPVLNQPIPLKSNSQTGFIVGGTQAPEASSPWQAMLWFKSTPLPKDKRGVSLERGFCGGVLVDDQWVLTAAHCIASFQSTYNRALQSADIIVRLGKRSRSRMELYERNVSVVDIKIADNFNGAIFDNDIALLKLAEHVEFSDHIRPICLGRESHFQTGREGLITGWGKVSTHGHRPDILQQVMIPIQNNTVCRASTNKALTANMFCAGTGRQTSGDSCKGDSGGPLSVREGRRWYLLGLVSWGEGCGQRGKYGFYTRVPNYTDWIQSTTGKT